MTTDPPLPPDADRSLDGSGPGLPPRPPRPLLVHFGVDSAVAFLALFMLGLLLGVPWGATALVALAIGACACRSTRRAEVRALAARRHPT